MRGSTDMADKEFTLRIITPGKSIPMRGIVDMVIQYHGRTDWCPSATFPDGDREAGYPAYYGEGRRKGSSIS